MKIFLGADHGGFELKEQAKAWFKAWGYEVEDCGAEALRPDDDYPPIALEVAQAVAKLQNQGQPAMGFLFCRSGGGMAIAANKVAGVRAVQATNAAEALHARVDNDANILSLAGDWVKSTAAQAIIKTFLSTQASQETRHQRRRSQIAAYEQQRHQA